MAITICEIDTASRHEYAAAVVIDVIRASTTITAILSRSPEALYVFGEPSEVMAWQNRPEDCLLFSEIPEKDFPLPHFDNSPARAAQLSMTGKTAAVVTSNGSYCMVHARAREVFAGGFCNMSALKTALREYAGEEIVLIPAGYRRSGQEAPEDSLFAAAFREELLGNTPDWPETIAQVKQHPDYLRRLNSRPREAFIADMEMALALDSLACLGRVQKNGDYTQVVTV
ncbi:2-phosphosulfolactate phosphatase [Planctomycetota bacterium]